MKLYQYIHCPYCIRVRMGLNFLGIPYTSIVLPYNDEATPIRLAGKKMLPIVEWNDESAQNESLDILKKADQHNKLHFEKLTSCEDKINLLLDKIGNDVHSMAMPYWIWTPEFTPESRNYFKTKKEIKRGPFLELIKKQDIYFNQLLKTLELEITPYLMPYYKSDTFTILDIVIASHLWGAYVVPEFQFPPNIHTYLQKIKKLTHFNYQLYQSLSV